MGLKVVTVDEHGNEVVQKFYDVPKIKDIIIYGLFIANDAGTTNEGKIITRITLEGMKE